MFAALRKLLTGWFGAPAETQADAIAPEAENAEILQSTAKVDEIRPGIDHPTPYQAVPYDENRYERALAQWQAGDRERLAKIDRGTLQHHPDRAEHALSAAAGRLQTGDDDESKRFTRPAQDWGINKKLVCRVLTSSVHKSLGRVAAIDNQQHRALKHFESAITFGTPGADAKLPTQARPGEQLQQLGQNNPYLPLWAIGKETVSVSASRSRHNQEVAGVNKDNQGNGLEQLSREILIKKILSSKKYLLERRAISNAPCSASNHENGLVSIIIPTRRPQKIDVIVRNVARQGYEKLELILVPHFYNDSSLKELKEKFESLKSRLVNLVILKIDDAIPLGARLNQAIEVATGDYWAKMDDDDLYFENYLSDIIPLFRLEDYAMVGKFEQFIYLSDIKKLILRHVGWHSRLSFISGATFVTSRRYGEDLRFGELEMGEDTALLKMAEERKLKVYAADCFNHVVMRSADLNDHTWQVSSECFLKEGSIVCDGFCEDLVRA
jgi:hypothetical protein